MSEIRTVGLIINSYKEKIIAISRDIIAQLKESGVNVIAIGKEAEALGLLPTEETMFQQQAQLVLVVGGDGTMLRAARTVYGTEIPLLGINQGYMGFLADVELNELQESIRRLLSGDFATERRMMLTGRVYRDGVCIAEENALNDLVVTKGTLSRIVKMELLMGDKLIDQYHGDGLIFSTPTGSTGYSLSAGGPIVYPSIDVCVVAPICQHSLTARPIIFSPDHRLTVHMMEDTASAALTVDGQLDVELMPGDIIEIEKAACDTKLIVLKERNFFAVMHGKFRGVQDAKGGEQR